MKYDTKFDIDPDSPNVEIPITIDFKPGRAEKGRNRTLWTIVAIIGILLIFFSLLFQPGHNFIVNLIVSLLWLSLTSTVLRFGYLREHKIRNQMINDKVNDYKIDTYGFWGILSIEDFHPYICRFRGKKSGVFVIMEKGVTSGNIEDTKNQHREAVSKFLHYIAKTNLDGVAANGLNVTHIDCMDFVGKDERIDLMIKNNQINCQLPILQKLLNQMYQNLKTTSQSKVYTNDIFVFTWKGRDDINLSIVKDSLNILLQGGYTSYHYMDRYELQELYKTLFNVVSFSVQKANAIAQGDISQKRWITPIMVKYANGGVYKINPTKQEKIKERQLQAARKARQKEQSKNKNAEFDESIYRTEELSSRPGYSGYVDTSNVKMTEEELKNITFKF